MKRAAQETGSHVGCNDHQGNSTIQPTIAVSLIQGKQPAGKATREESTPMTAGQKFSVRIGF